MRARGYGEPRCPLLVHSYSINTFSVLCSSPAEQVASGSQAVWMVMAQKHVALSSRKGRLPGALSQLTALVCDTSCHGAVIAAMIATCPATVIHAAGLPDQGTPLAITQHVQNITAPKVRDLVKATRVVFVHLFQFAGGWRLAFAYKRHGDDGAIFVHFKLDAFGNGRLLRGRQHTARRDGDALPVRSNAWSRGSMGRMEDAGMHK